MHQGSEAITVRSRGKRREASPLPAIADQWDLVCCRRKLNLKIAREEFACTFLLNGHV